MIVVGLGRPGRTSLSIFLLNPPSRQVSSPLTYWGGGGVRYIPPVILRPLWVPLSLLILAERVDVWLLLPLSTSHTGGATSPPHNLKP